MVATSGAIPWIQRRHDQIMGAMGKAATNDARASLPPPPWARVQRVQLIRREVREYLPNSTVELLLSRAQSVVEAGDEVGPTLGPPQRRVYATVMMSIELGPGAPLFREPPDEATAERVAELLESTPALRRRLVELARPELSRLAGTTALEISVEHRARAEGSTILVDGDAMAVAQADGAPPAN